MNYSIDLKTISAWADRRTKEICMGRGEPAVIPRPNGVLWQWEDVRWIERTETADAVRYRWASPELGMGGVTFHRAPRWAQVLEDPSGLTGAHYWPHERTPDEHRAHAGALTAKERHGMWCPLHKPWAVAACGCDPVKEELGMEELLGATLPVLSTNNSEGTVPEQAAGGEDLAQQAPAEPPPAAPTFDGPPGGGTVLPPGELVGSWIVECSSEDCSEHRLKQGGKPPGPNCTTCGEPLEVVQSPELVLSPKARQMVDECDMVPREVKRKSKSKLCEICLKPGWERGEVYFSRSEKDSRRMHALCLEVACRGL